MTTHFTDPVEIPTPPEPESEPPPDEKRPPIGLATGIVAIVNSGCTISTYALSEREVINLHRDVLSVLVKHDIDDIPLGEEIALAGTLVEVATPRVRAWRKKKADASDDSTGSRQKGERQDCDDTQADTQAAPATDTASSVLA